MVCTVHYTLCAAVHCGLLLCTTQCAVAGQQGQGEGRMTRQVTPFHFIGSREAGGRRERGQQGSTEAGEKGEQGRTHTLAEGRRHRSRKGEDEETGEQQGGRAEDARKGLVGTLQAKGNKVLQGITLKGRLEIFLGKEDFIGRKINKTESKLIGTTKKIMN